jgi:alpha-glucosidase
MASCKVIMVFMFCVLHGVTVYAQRAVKLTSPDNSMTAVIVVDSANQLSYTLRHKMQVLVWPSPLGLHLNGLKYGSHVSSIRVSSPLKENNRYPVTGKHTLAINSCRTYTLTIKESGKKYLLLAKVFNDGFAYRYRFDGSPSNYITEEFSSFKLPAKSRIWFFERDNDWKLKSYAGEWKSAAIDSMEVISRQGPVQGKPIVAGLASGGYMAVTEAALYNYSGMRLAATGNRSFRVNFTEGVRGFDVKGRVTSPWRVVIYGGNLNELVNSDIITNLNPPPDKNLYKDQQYIRPGRAVWSWMTRDSNYLHPEREAQFIDHASNLNFEYTLIDEGWENQWPDKWQQLKALCRYALARRVGVWVWKHSNQLQGKKIRRAFLDSVAAAGAVGLKVDFMNSEAKTMIDFDISLLRDAAARKLMIVLHGCQAPSGESRTYPNELNREGIRGMELNAMQEGPVTAAHNAALPFTRLVTGHGDYTPGFFRNPGEVSWGQQLACMYLFDSPFLCMAENPAYLFDNTNLSQIIPFIRNLPVTWDETIVLPGSDIGKIAAVAKRKNNDWYIVAVNGENRSKVFAVNTAFLSANRVYEATLINDAGAQPRQLGTTNMGGVRRGTIQTIRLQANGGFVIRLLPQQTK